MRCFKSHRKSRTFCTAQFDEFETKYEYSTCSGGNSLLIKSLNSFLDMKNLAVNIFLNKGTFVSMKSFISFKRGCVGIFFK